MGLAATFLDQLDFIGDWGLLATAADLTITGWNPWLEQRSGLAAKDVLGRGLFDLFPELAERRLDRYFHQALSGQTVLLSQRLHQYVIPLPPAIAGTGRERMQQSVRIVPLLDGDAVRGTLTMIEDVTERVISETELGSRARRQAALAALARSALSGTDAAALAAEGVGHFRATLGADATEVLELQPDGRGWTVLAGSGWVKPPGPNVEIPTAPRTLAALQFDVATPAENVATDPIFRTDELLKVNGVTSALVVRVPGQGHRPFGLLGAYWRSGRRFAADELQFAKALADIVGVAAERKRLEGELRLRVGELADADRRKDEFLAMLAHELRNPLAPVRNALQILRTKCGGDPLVDRMGDMMTRQVGHMARIVDDLLDVSRFTSGKVNIRKERVELAVVVSRAVETCRALIDSRGHDLDTLLPPEPVYLDADPTRLAQVLSNLLNNAAKYTEEGGQIRLAAYRDSDDVVISVRDTGTGIPGDVLPHIFDLFAQDTRSLDRAEGGLGIGLTLVRRLVELHGGSVKASSEGPGTGSEFLVRLPALTGNVLSQAVGSIVPEQPARVAPRRILIVDDNVDSAESLALLLNLNGHDVHTAGDGPSALLAAQAHRPEVILLDIGLPRMDGYEVARRLRQDFPPMILIAMTGYGQDDDRRKARAAGFDHHLVKPVDPNELVSLFG
jgi:PAS domain S-box-containing protein